MTKHRKDSISPELAQYLNERKKKRKNHKQLPIDTIIKQNAMRQSLAEDNPPEEWGVNLWHKKGK